MKRFRVEIAAYGQERQKKKSFHVEIAAYGQERQKKREKQD